MERRYWGVYFVDCCDNASLDEVFLSEEDAIDYMEEYNDDSDLTCEEYYYVNEISKEKAEKFLEKWG